MAAEVKQSTTGPTRKELTEEEEKDLAMLAELVRIYYNGP